MFGQLDAFWLNLSLEEPSSLVTIVCSFISSCFQSLVLIDIDQLTRIMNIVGTPSEDFLLKVQSEEARNYIRNLPYMPRKDFRQLFPTASPSAIDLIERMLVLDPDHRISVLDALCHEYLSEYSSPNDEPVSNESLSNDADEENATSIEHWRG